MSELQLMAYEKRTKRENAKRGRRLGISAREAALCLLGLPIAMAMPYSGIAPFGLSFLAQERRLSGRTLLMFAAVCAGSIAACDRVGAAKYIGAAIIYLAVLFVLEKGIKIGDSAAAIAAGAALLPVGLTAMYWQGFSAGGVLLLLCEATAVTAGAFVMDKSIQAFSGNTPPEQMSADERVSLAAVAVIAVMGLKPVYIGSDFSVMNTAASMAVMLAASSCGMSYAAAAGVILGIVCGIGGDFFMPILGAYAFCGFLSGVFSKFGKGGVIAGMVIANAILVVYTNGAMDSVLTLYEVMVSAVIFVFVPKRVTRAVKRFIYIGEKDRESIVKLKGNLREKLNGVSGSFAALAHTLKRLSDKEKEAEVTEVAALFDMAADKICRDCRKSAVCWGKDFNSTYKSLFRLLEIMEERGSVKAEDVTDYFKDKCLNLPKLLEEINRQYELYKASLAWKGRLKESRELVGEQLCGVSKIIESIADEIENDSGCDSVTAEEIVKKLEVRGVRTDGISVTRDRNGRHTVKLEMCGRSATEKNRSEAFDIIRETLPRPIDLHERRSKDEKRCVWEFEETERFEVETGFAGAGASEKSGDNCRFTRLGCGKYVAILSDGMGTGARASRESNAIIELLESFIRAGFDSGIAVKLINSIMVIKSENETFATLDICVIDLYTGEAEFIKTGAEPSFIMQKNGVETVRAASLPVGVVAGIETDSTVRCVKDGDTIVMITDGIEGKSGDSGRIKSFIEKERACGANELANAILRNAIGENEGNENDDMTVITLKIRQRRELLHVA